MEDNNFWKKSELANQHVHAWWGFWSTFILWSLFLNNWFLLTGLVVGLVVEISQWIGGAEDYIQRKWKDIIRDLIFWWIGGLLNYMYLIVLIWRAG